ncbi:hypothetical protein O3W44_22165 [Pantoea sp. LMR881]|uniref:phage tail fiber protein n=1 Tax=Pantoea sp. LMR881 TaxID=3014336 RepID=UPI0022B05EE4|nr:hypothetical protein [Pantoea sp. LMR881]MCZ4061238.1 hypothetical protein [Pantoea sp. LMR881]
MGYGGVLGYLSTYALKGGGGRVFLNANNDSIKTTAGINLDGSAGTITFTGDATFSGAVNFNGIINANRHDSCIMFSSSDNSKPIIAANYSSAGNFGFWDTTNSGWLLRKDTSDNWIMPANLTVGGSITAPGEIISNVNGNNVRMANGTYGVIHRNYGSNYYVLLTDSGDPQGNYNSLRPITVALSSGLVTLGNSAKVIGNLEVTGAASLGNSLTVSGGAAFASTVNVSGKMTIANSLSVGNAGTGTFASTTASLNIGDSDTGFVSPGAGLLDVYCNNAQVARFQPGGIVSKGVVYTGNGASYLNSDGNVYGSVWGGWLSNRLASIESNSNSNAMSDFGRGGQQFKAGGDWIGAWECPAGCVMTGLNSDYNDGRKMGIYFRQLIGRKISGAQFGVGDFA